MALPSREQLFHNALVRLDQAYAALGDAADWLRSDWAPIGSALTSEQSDQRTRMFAEIAHAKQAINRARN